MERMLNEISTNPTDLDGISSKMLKIAYPYSHSALTNIVNQSLSLGEVPHCWKKALVIAIPEISTWDSRNIRRTIN